MMRTSNPAFNQPAFAPPDWRGIAADQVAAQSGPRGGMGNVGFGSGSQASSTEMTLSGTMMKTSFLLGLCALSAILVYAAVERGMIQGAAVLGGLIGGIICTIILSLIVGFNPKSAPYLAWAHALLQGVVLGLISYFIADQLGPKADGLIFQAITLTMGIMAAALVVTWTGIVRVGNTGKKILSVAVTGIMLVYLVNIVMSLFGFGGMGFIHSSGPIGIGFSLFVVGIASFNLVNDFQNVHTAVANRAPKYMEWYSGFALLTTLVWLYIEILRLLAKLRSN